MPLTKAQMHQEAKALLASETFNLIFTNLKDELIHLAIHAGTLQEREDNRSMIKGMDKFYDDIKRQSESL
jgi:hypothetical protein